MRILYVFPGIVVGGAEIRTFEMCRRLKQFGHEPIVACKYGPCGDLAHRMGIQHHPLNIKRYRLDPWAVLRCLLGLIGIIIRNQIDIVVTHHRSMAFVAHYATRVTSTPHVFMNVNVFSDKPWLRWTGDITIAIGNACLENALNFLKANPARCILVYRGVEIPDFLLTRNQSRKRLNIPSQVPLVGTVCRLVPEKGVHFLLQAMVTVFKDFEDAVLLIVGDGPEKEKLELLRADLGLSAEKILFLGERRDVWEILPSLDVFVNPSVAKEGLGAAMIEAAACGVPLVGTLCGGIPEVIENGRNGILVPPSDIGALAKALLRLLANPAFAHELGERASQIVREKFSKEHEVVQHIKIYEALLNGYKDLM